MINTNKKIKKLFLLLLTLSLFSTINIDKVVAGYNPGQNKGGGNGGENGDENGDVKPPKTYDNTPSDPSAFPAFWGTGAGSNCYSFTCSVSVSTNIKSSIYIDMRDMYGKEMIGNSLNDINTNILAGTYVYLDVYEEKSYSSSVSYKATTTKKVYTCQKTTYNNCITTINGKCVSGTETETKIQDCGCDSGYLVVGITTETITSGADESRCGAQATPTTYDLQPSYNAIYPDSNDIDGENKGDGYYTAETITRDKVGNCEAVNKEEGNTKSSSESCRFHYNRGNVCINVKNGKVRYLEQNGNGGCNADEYKITSKDGLWKLFIPLNANSANDFTFTLEGANKESGDFCQSWIEDNPSIYAEIIVGPRKESLKGMSQSGAMNRVADGCYLQSVVTIPVEQKFYNEVNKGNNFKGFNFYYKPIDINNPFPNGVTQSSLWYDWSKGKNQEPDISESYKEVTYIAEYLDGESLRNYNKYDDAAYRKLYRTWYSDWQENMDVDGSSDFIDEGEYVTRYVNRDSYYPLGCGPANTNVNNIFTQKECNKR